MGNAISLVSASGSILANADVIGGVVISLPTIADFNNDGLNDIIISTPNAYAATNYVNFALPPFLCLCRYYGYALQSSTGSVLFPSLLILLLGVMAVLTIVNHVHLSVPKQPSHIDKKAWASKRNL